MHAIQKNVCCPLWTFWIDALMWDSFWKLILTWESIYIFISFTGVCFLMTYILSSLSNAIELKLFGGNEFQVCPSWILAVWFLISWLALFSIHWTCISSVSETSRYILIYIDVLLFHHLKFHINLTVVGSWYGINKSCIMDW